MSLVAEEIARREAEMMKNPDEVVVSIPVIRIDSLVIPCSDGDEEETAIFKVMTYGDHTIIEKASRYQVDRGDGKTTHQIDFNEMRRLSLKRNLIRWSLDIDIERENGWVTKDCYCRIGRVYGPLIESFLDKYWDTCEVSKEEEEEMQKQASILFGKNSRGVMDACEGIKSYCTRSSFSEKFGMDSDEINQLPFREYLMLKMISGYESEAMRRNKKVETNHSNTRIAGPGGRTRSSRAKRIPM